MRDMYVMIKPVSGTCNMRCQYCFYIDEMEHRESGNLGRMTLEVLEEVVKKTLEVAEGSCTFAYQGGEPTLAGLEFFQTCMELQHRYAPKGVRVCNVIQTNGIGLTEEWCRFLAQYQFLVGISMDGLKGIHDAYRRTSAGEETYLQVLESINRLERWKVPYNVLTVVHAKTAQKIKKIYERYQKMGIAYQQYIVCLDPIEQGHQEYSLTPELYGQFLIELFEVWEMDLKRGCQPSIRQFENWIGILRGIIPEACEQRGVCGIQNIIEADGSVYPCDFYTMDGYRIGNICEQTWEEIDRNREQIGFRQQSQQWSETCRDCKYFVLCRGGCRRHRGKDGRNLFCEGYRKFFETCYPKLEAIALGRIK